jgi:hypothetical protein
MHFIYNKETTLKEEISIGNVVDSKGTSIENVVDSTINEMSNAVPNNAGLLATLFGAIIGLAFQY